MSLNTVELKGSRQKNSVLPQMWEHRLLPQGKVAGPKDQPKTRTNQRCGGQSKTEEEKQ